MPRFSRLTALIAAAGLLLLPACTEEGEEAEGQASFPVSLNLTNGSVDIASMPERIVSLSPSATESLFAIGAGPQVVAVDEDSTYPEDAPATDLTSVNPEVDGVLDYEPDLVVLSYSDEQLLDELQAEDIPAVVHPPANDLEQVYGQMIDLGTATGHKERAAELADEIRLDVRLATTHEIHLEEEPTVYHESDPDYSTVRSNSLIGSIYEEFGFHNIADDRPGGAPTTQLSSRFIREQDPDMIFLADVQCCGQSPQSASQRPGWDELSATETGSIFEIEDELANTWGPRVLELIHAIEEGFEKHRTAAGLA
jgi:iron complex transport system substrate-binding protein